MPVVVVLAPLILLPLLNLALHRRLERQGYRPSCTPPSSDPGHRFDEARSVVFRGGSTVGRGNATTPLVELRFDESWAHLSGTAQLFGGPAPVWIERSAVLGVHRIGVPVSPGVRFESNDGRYDGVIFWTHKSSAVLRALRDHGWPVMGSTGDEADARPA